MINTSNEYKEYVAEARDFIHGVEITLADNTVLNIDDAHIRSMKINDITSQSGSFTFGALINELTVIIDNSDDEFSDYDFEGAVLRPTIGLTLSATTETLQKGVFVADEYKVKDSVLTIIALDKMALFDTPFSDVIQTFPCTVHTLLNTVCIHCGVSLGTSVFNQDNYVIQARPDDTATTCREIVAWIAQIAGCFARVNDQGSLELKWYDFEVFELPSLDGGTFDDDTPYASGDSADGGNFTDYSTGSTLDGGTFTETNRYHHIYALGSSTFATDDVVITGIQVTDTAETPATVLFGSTGYVIAIEGNQLIQSASDAQTVANSVGALMVGMRFRPCSLSAVSDPSREAGDVAYIADRKQNTYQTLLTNVTFETGKYDKISCDAETPLHKKSVRYSASTKAIIEARKVAKQEVSSYDQTVQQFLNLMTYGFGLFKSSEVLPDRSTIYYMHDKATIAESSAVWKFNSNGIFLSSDHGVTWGVDTNGNMLVNVLTAIGINAEWIKVITSFTVGGNFSVNALGELTAKKGTIGPFILDANGLKSNSMQLLDSNVNPLIWLNSADKSEHANYEGSAAYLVNSNAPNRQTALLDSRMSYLLGVELTKETINDNSDASGTVIERTKYTADGISKTSTSGFQVYTMNIFGNLVMFTNNGIYIQSVNGCSIDMSNANGLYLQSPSGKPIYLNGVAH